MSGREFKTSSEYETSSKYQTKSGYKKDSDYSFSKEEKDLVYENIDELDYQELKILQKHLDIKSKAKSKSGLKKAIKADLKRSQEKPMGIKTLNEMSLAELRVVANRYGVKSGGIKKGVLKKRIAKEQSKHSPDENLQNLPSGSSITTAFYDGDKMGSDYDVSIIDKDVEPHKEAKILDQGSGVMLIEQTTVLGEQEVTAVTISDSEQGIKNKQRLAELEAQVAKSEDNDKRGFRGRNAEKQVKDMFEKQGYEVKDVSRDKKKHYDLEVIINNNKIPVEVKEYNERIEGKEPRKGRLQFERKYVKQMEKKKGIYVIVKTDKLDKQEIAVIEAKEIMKLSKGKGEVFIVSQEEIAESVETEIETRESEFPVQDAMVQQMALDMVVDQEMAKKESQLSYSDNIIEPQKYADFPKGSAWKEARIIHEKRRKEYTKRDLVPILHPIRGKQKTGNKQPGNEVVDIKELKMIPKVDILHEKSYPELEEHKNDSLLSTGGQNLQNVYSDNLEYKGVFFQDSTFEEPINHFAVANEIWVDSDDAGHYIGYMNNLFTRTDKKGNPDPYYPNVRFKTKDGFTKPKAVNEPQAIRFWVGNHIDSAGYRRNLVLSAPVIRQLIGKKALSYRSAQGKNITFKLSEQKLAICNAIYNPKKLIIIKTADMPSGISFPFIAHDIKIKPEDKPILAFTRNKEQELTRLTSDDMIRIMVDTMQVEPDQAQSTLEALYQAEWINYPRSDTTKAEHEHIYLLKDINEFEGTSIEKQTLQIIHDSETAFKAKENYKDNGTWKLINKNTVLVSTEGYKLPYMKKEYTNDEFDISIQSKGINPSDLTKFISDNEIGTPATRMTQFAELKEAGIVKKVGDVYVVDKRGLILSATYDYYNENSWSVINLKQQLKDEESVDRMIDLLGFIQPLTKEEKEKAIKEIKAVSKELIEGEKDIATLDGF